MEEEDAGAQHAVEDGEGAVEGHVLVVLAEHPHHETGEDQRHDDEVRALHDLGRDELLLIHAGQAAVVGRTGGLDHGEDEDDQDDHRDQLGHEERRVDLQPAMVFPAVVLQIKGDREEDDAQGNSPT